MRSYSLHFQFYLSSNFNCGSYENICVHTIGSWTVENSYRGEIEVTFHDKRTHVKVMTVPISVLRTVPPPARSKEVSSSGLIVQGANFGKIVNIKYKKGNKYRVHDLSSPRLGWWEDEEKLCKLSVKK